MNIKPLTFFIVVLAIVLDVFSKPGEQQPNTHNCHGKDSGLCQYNTHSQKNQSPPKHFSKDKKREEDPTSQIFQIRMFKNKEDKNRKINYAFKINKYLPENKTALLVKVINNPNDNEATILEYELQDTDNNIDFYLSLILQKVILQNVLFVQWIYQSCFESDEASIYKSYDLMNFSKRIQPETDSMEAQATSDPKSISGDDYVENLQTSSDKKVSSKLINSCQTNLKVKLDPKVMTKADSHELLFKKKLLEKSKEKMKTQIPDSCESLFKKKFKRSKKLLFHECVNTISEENECMEETPPKIKIERPSPISNIEKPTQYQFNFVNWDNWDKEVPLPEPTIDQIVKSDFSKRRTSTDGTPDKCNVFFSDCIN